MRYRNILFILLLCMVSMLAMDKPVIANAASYKMVDSNTEAKFGDKVIGFSWYEHKIWLSDDNGKWIIVKDDDLAWGATTNGTDIYYGIFYGQINDLNNGWGIDVYKKNISTNKTREICRVKYGTKVVMYNNGVLYLETANRGGAEIPYVEQYSISSGKRKILYAETSIDSIKGNYLICASEPGEFDNTGHYFYKVCVYNYKKKKGKILAKQGFNMLQYGKNKICYIKVFENNRIYKGQLYEYNLKTGKNKAISKTFQSSLADIKIKGKKLIYYDKKNKKRTLKIK